MTDYNLNHQDISINVRGNNQPPNYSIAISQPREDSDLPPSYEDLFSKLKKAKDDSKNPVEYIVKACSILCGTFLITVLFGISIAIPITMIVIGAKFKNECTIQEKIPIWLIVSGTFGCLSVIIRTITNCYNLYKTKENDEHKSNKKNCLTSIIELFLFAWFICGNVWVYSVHKRVSQDPLSLNYCNPVCYYFAFWVITIGWILTAILFCCCCCILVIAGCGIGAASIFGPKS